MLLCASRTRAGTCGLLRAYRAARERRPRALGHHHRAVRAFFYSARLRSLPGASRRGCAVAFQSYALTSDVPGGDTSRLRPRLLFIYVEPPAPRRVTSLRATLPIHLTLDLALEWRCLRIFLSHRCLTRLVCRSTYAPPHALDVQHAPLTRSSLARLPGRRTTPLPLATIAPNAASRANTRADAGDSCANSSASLRGRRVRIATSHAVQHLVAVSYGR